jgi:hypothetical protein
MNWGDFLIGLVAGLAIAGLVSFIATRGRRG